MAVREDLSKQQPQSVARYPVRKLTLYGRIAPEQTLSLIASPQPPTERPLTVSPTLRWQVDVPRVKWCRFQTDMKIFFWKVALTFTLNANQCLKRWLAIRALQLFRDKLQELLDGRIIAPPATEVLMVVQTPSPGLRRVV